MANSKTKPEVYAGRETITQSRLNYLMANGTSEAEDEIPPFIEMEGVRYRRLRHYWVREGKPDGSETLVID